MPVQQRRRRQDDEDEDMQQQVLPSDDDADYDGDARMEDVGHRDETSQLIKNLVRYALACEYSRTPIRRDGIRDKVLGPNNGRAFKKVFAGAQRQLRATFGMEMVELPTKDRNLMTAEQKRKAAKSQSQKEPSSNAYVLVSVLPEGYRTPAIITPSKVQSADGEASYIALYTMIIAIITLSGGELSDPRLRRHLTRLNAVENMPGMNPNDETSPNEKTEVVLQRMIKQGYLVKVTESKSMGDDDSTTWHVGPRGKVEVGPEAIAAFVRTVYGGLNDELEKKLQVSLKIKDRNLGVPETVGEETGEADQVPPDGDPGSSNRRRGRRG
ncbi:MAGE family-domain-containing protein [Achaetomium macrosporum]|uniref:MAGE family-domain-containing protein n=1 Tax=Achaetomium macrosporum TaxID=79813 RepID=A0AAN7CHA6_9PEZI|nr:MAGE family-domain-containing protein [Achaetomium macrosporum]